MKFFYMALIIGLLSGCMHKPEAIDSPAPIMQKTLSNDELANQVYMAITEDHDINQYTSIRVIAQGHHVVLLGQSPKGMYSNKAEHITNLLTSTDQVFNYITIQEPLSHTTRARDLALNTEIQNALRNQSLLKSGQIVTTENKVVYFIGSNIFENYEPVEKVILKIEPSATIIPISLP
jgi:osmotically-inducible protein OsmY